MQEAFRHPSITSSTLIILDAFVSAEQNRLRFCIVGSGGWAPSINAPASWTAVAQMQGASLHRRHRFRQVRPILLPQPDLQPPIASLVGCRPLPPYPSRHTPTPTGSLNIAKGCRASARLPWHPCQFTGKQTQNSATPNAHQQRQQQAPSRFRLRAECILFGSETHNLTWGLRAEAAPQSKGLACESHISLS